MKGFFVTFEGIDGCGKSTQARRLAAHVRALGWEVVHTREPGATRLGKRIRQVFLDSDNMKITARTEVLLMAADRSDHVAQVIIPSLERGAVVICERYTDSTEAYQGYAGGISLDVIRELNAFATGGLAPDVTFVLDFDPAAVASRRSRKPDRMESRDLDFHRRVREGYVTIARENPERVVLIDAVGSPEEVHRRIKHSIERRLPGIRARGERKA